jgi:hypothetical protein
VIRVLSASIAILTKLKLVSCLLLVLSCAIVFALTGRTFQNNFNSHKLTSLP